MKKVYIQVFKNRKFPLIRFEVHKDPDSRQYQVKIFKEGKNGHHIKTRTFWKLGDGPMRELSEGDRRVIDCIMEQELKGMI
jgi:hypothetical protein